MVTNFKQRTFTGVGLVILIVAAVRFGPYTFCVLLMTINLLGIQEFYRLMETSTTRPSYTTAYLLSTALIISCLSALNDLASRKWLLLNIPLTFAVFMAALYRPAKQPFQSLSITFMGLICVSLPLCFFLASSFLISQGGYDFEVPLGVFLLLWTNDTGAYLLGRLLGKHPLFLRISPKKTWEGSLGGGFASVAVSYFISHYFTFLNVFEWGWLSLIIVVSGTFGDLIKSMLKRSIGVKDSGTLLPGHGGILDRFDSLLGSAPFVFAYLILLER